MKIEPGKVYNMPLVAGALFDISDRPRYVYEHVENLILQYQTDPDAIQELLPECYQVGKEPTVTLAFSHNDGVEFLSGRGYRIATVMVTARFDGEKDHEEGNHVIVMFEDDTLPIIGGREHLGVPKIYADISPIKTLPEGGHLRCEVSLWGHLLYGVDGASPSKRTERHRARRRQPDKNAALFVLQIHPRAGWASGRQLPDYLVHGHTC
jgi:acetoacetate decarboxylase